MKNHELKAHHYTAFISTIPLIFTISILIEYISKSSLYSLINPISLIQRSFLIPTISFALSGIIYIHTRYYLYSYTSKNIELYRIYLFILISILLFIHKFVFNTSTTSNKLFVFNPYNFDFNLFVLKFVFILSVCKVLGEMVVNERCFICYTRVEGLFRYVVLSSNEILKKTQTILLESQRNIYYSFLFCISLKMVFKNTIFTKNILFIFDVVKNLLLVSLGLFIMVLYFLLIDKIYFYNLSFITHSLKRYFLVESGCIEERKKKRKKIDELIEKYNLFKHKNDSNFDRMYFFSMTEIFLESSDMRRVGMFEKEEIYYFINKYIKYEMEIIKSSLEVLKFNENKNKSVDKKFLNEIGVVFNLCLKKSNMDRMEYIRADVEFCMSNIYDALDVIFMLEKMKIGEEDRNMYAGRNVNWNNTLEELKVLVLNVQDIFGSCVGMCEKIEKVNDLFFY